ncbi:NAD(P)H-binding protein [Pseudomonas sp. S75]|uniref:NAD(P)H-binding protein n=1 Tax=unclassified Pseudomonas TaxID=196821 RepID=UPI00190648DC|nr:MULTISPECIES: NAD(P)H-binding protein [unclassified Pseudomonas]MBJ9974128.1 NAD(P)H-binding protein [Pseudomonas sp. S30]MBK0151942.1 NAD(P)H-binding protein [Pseudomonas sp. S75]
MKQRICVTGSNGPLGRRVVELLLRHPEEGVTAGSRTPEQLMDLAARGARITKVDFDAAETLEAAFTGVDRVLITSTDGIGALKLSPRQIRKASDAAAKAGVRHIVYTSAADTVAASTGQHTADWRSAEDAVQAAGVPCTILRAGWYAELLLARVPAALRYGAWLTTSASGHVPYVARNDVARAAAAALRAGTAHSEVRHITGPKPLLLTELVNTLDLVFGCKLKLESVGSGDLAQRLASRGVAPLLMDQILSMEASIRGGADGTPDAIAEMTGTAPRALAELLLDQRLDLLVASALG